ncbi:MAG TPA: preprotein translocase subunit SecE [Candidatus Lambdaproteobacteria bacterium]|jgi:preprotein translocase subunit SecE|uniref:Protein translocase subunit SecE n=1 Tax=SAR324 cluster bacterium TaxID=2024889 RepID=A0A432G544_9DELT|nr:preprotein translocase subunit SecE [SAR324 cluster bacterium]HBL56603.1 preprotein translocase subunit SecE [Deltaproteobacteria bacterium]HHZ78000.1 preprotein translocase subunit SecE [Candidatus Lambdaproteobacteria bacterium]RTZ78301.1 MAG: preprotein translocase subunit SecE [SAR324 cluster bacterium]HIA57281.1 preprotein translocase subunit SecE [Candidatus Lambdaproteobacteria bacterium]
MFKRITQFFKDVIAEFKRVQWPTREATIKSTSVVVAVSLVIALYLGIADLGLSDIMQMVIAG